MTLPPCRALLVNDRRSRIDGAVPADETAQLLAHPVHLGLRHRAGEGQCQRGASDFFGHAKIAAAVTEPATVERLEVDRREIGT